MAKSKWRNCKSHSMLANRRVKTTLWINYGKITIILKNSTPSCVVDDKISLYVVQMVLARIMTILHRHKPSTIVKDFKKLQ